MIRVAVIGAGGRMGVAIGDALEADDRFDVAGRITSDDLVESLAANRVDVALDVTNADAARVNLPQLAEKGIDCVVGTTGFDADDVARFDDAFRAAGKRCFLVPNFSIGAVLLMRFAAEAAPYFDGVEIIELHHDRKRDAPSGTARLTAERIAGARDEPWADDPTEHVSAPGARGGTVAGVPVHSVRLRGLLAHEEVIFGAAGQALTLRHDSFDHSAFVGGALKALAGVHALEPGVTTGLDAVL